MSILASSHISATKTYLEVTLPAAFASPCAGLQCCQRRELSRTPKTTWQKCFFQYTVCQLRTTKIVGIDPHHADLLPWCFLYEHKSTFHDKNLKKKKIKI